MKNLNLIYLFALVLLSVNMQAQTPCSGGTAGGYSCDGITLQSYFSPPQLGSGSIEAQDSWGWTDPVGGKKYAIVALDNATAFVDITDPVNPIRLGHLPTHSGTGSAYWRDVKVYNNHAYVVSDQGGHGMQIFDLTTLRSYNTDDYTRTFSEDGWVNWSGSFSRRKAHNVVINEDSGYAYVVGLHSGIANGGVLMYDLSNPTSPTLDGSISAYGYCHDAQVVTYNGPDTDHTGKELLIGSFSGSNDLIILDVSTKNSVSYISDTSYGSSYYTHQGWFTDDQRFFIIGDELDESNIGGRTRTFVYDMQDLDNPTLVYTHSGTTNATDHNGYVSGNRYYLANYKAGMRVFKIDGLYDPSPSMTEVNYFDTVSGANSAGTEGLWNVYPFFESGNLVATGFGKLSSNSDGGLFVLRDPNFDSTDPVANCQNYTATLDPSTATVTIDVTDLDNGSTDNIGIVSRTLTGQTTFSCDDVGQTFDVTLTVTDDYGNTDSCIAQVTVAGSDTNWTGSWSDGAPQPGSNAVIDSNYDMTSLASIDACTCQVNNGATLTVTSGKYLKTEKDITVNTGGSLIVEHQGSIVQVDDNASVTNDGTINVNITTPDLGSRDFMLMGSPMTAESRTDVWASAFLVLNHDASLFVPNAAVAAAFPGAENFADDNYDNWIQYNGAINPGEGYIVRPQAGYGQPGGIFNYTHDSGTLNNGEVNFTTVFNGTQNGSPNAVANPYPSAIKASDFISANSSVDAVYFWEHLQPPSPNIPGAGSMNFSMENISMRNGVGGTAATITQGVNNGATSAVPNDYISTAQGFLFKASSNAGVVFNNSMRVTDNNNTLRTPDGKDRIWIGIGTGQYNLYRTALVGFMEEATAGYDAGYDAKRLATVLSVYTHQEDGSGQYGIQGREPFESGMKVPMGFSTLIDENTSYKISIDQMEGGNLEGATVYLKDNEDPDGELHDLTAAPYSFQSNKGTFHNRFTLLFVGQPILSTDDPLASSINVFPNPAREHMNIYSPAAKIESIELYDLLGKPMESTLEVPATSTMVELKTIETGMYFLRINTDAGTIVKKILKH